MGDIREMCCKTHFAMELMDHEDARALPCDAQVRHPWLSKPPVPQAPHQIALMSYSLTWSGRARAKAKEKICNDSP